MAGRRSKDIVAEIEASLAKGQPHPQATIADWKKQIAAIQTQARSTTSATARALLQEQLTAAYDGLKATTTTTAMKPTYVTSTNLSALTRLVVEHGGPTFPSRVHAVDAPHIKRCVEAGLIEVAGNTARLTREGRERVADELVQDIARESNYRPRENTFVPDPAKRAALLAVETTKHAAKLQQLEDVLAKIR